MYAVGRLFVCFFLVAAASSLNAAIPDSERQALLKLYQATGGDGWTDKTGWGGAAGTECQWFGVRCNQDSTVMELLLYSNNLTGNLPAELSALPNLEVIYMTDNAMSGPFPEVVTSLPKLRVLSLSNNDFTGSIPSNIGSVKTLESLELYGNRLGGTIPDSIGSLSNLRDLTLFDNELTGAIPDSLGQLTNLTYFALSQNRLTGRIPASLGNLRALESLYLGGNQLDGEIPPQLGQLTNLKVLFLSGNRLTGTVPPLSALTRLEELDLGYNELSGPIPPSLGDIQSLRFLWLSLNKFSGPIPPELGRLRNLELLNLDYSGVSGPIPTQLGDLSALVMLAIAQNGLTGTIPPELGKLGNLEELSLWGNQLEGTVPPQLAQLTKLRRLGLNHNRLTGPLPDLSALTELTSFDLSANPIGGEIPRWLGNLRKLQFIGMFETNVGGPIPSELANLTELEDLYLYGNRLTGTIPDWLGSLPRMTAILLAQNLLEGGFPQSLTRLTNLSYLALQANRLSGELPANFGDLRNLEFLELADNAFTGPLPPSMSQMTKLYYAILSNNEFSGDLPSLAGMTDLGVFVIDVNRFSGPFPMQLTNLTNLEVLSLSANLFTGPIPREIGRLTNLEYLGLNQNGFKGEIPRELTNLTRIAQGQLDLNYNALYTTDPVVREFVNSKHYAGAEWESTQTVAPTSVAVGQVTDRDAVISWKPIGYIYDEGGYRVSVSTTPGGAPEVVATTGWKDSEDILVRGLRPSTTYYATVATVTHPHDYQQNFLMSDATAPVSFTTGPRVLAPADVAVTKRPTGLIQVGSVPQNEDNFIVANFGDLPSTITVTKSAGADFFEVSPLTFTLAPGASQTVRIVSLPKPPGSYWSGVNISGDGVDDEDAGMFIELLSAAAPSGTVEVEAQSSRIDVSGNAGSTTVATVVYKNLGTAELSGVLSSDVPWISTPAAIISIPPGELRTVNFNIDRTKRSDDEQNGTVSGNLALVYVDGTRTGASMLGVRPFTTLPPGVSTTIVKVVDTTQLAVSSANAPSLSPREVARFIPGVRRIKDATRNVVSDITFANAFGAKALTDLRMYFLGSGSSSASLAPISPVAPSEAFTIANVVSVYGPSASSGSLQVRSVDWDSLDLFAALYTISSTGSRGGTLPVFRSDRGARAGERIYLVGISRSATRRGDLIVQEVAGGAASVSVEYLDPSGRTVGTASAPVALAPFAMAELPDNVPAGASTAVVTVAAGSAGRVAAYVQMNDSSSGDAWSVVDWSRYFDYAPADSALIPYAVADSGQSGRRRPVRPTSSGQPATAVSTTDVYFFNRSNAPSEGRLKLDGGSAQVRVTIPPRATLTLEDVVARTFGRSGKVTAALTYEPVAGEVSIAAHVRNVSGGAAIPVVRSASGLRLGESQVFAGLDDAQVGRVDKGEPGTYRSNLVLQETAGARVKVRASLLFADGRAIVATNLSRDFDLAPREMVTLERISRAIIGAARDTQYGDLHGMQLQVRVIEGDGALLPLIVVTENGSNDSLVRAE